MLPLASYSIWYDDNRLYRCIWLYLTLSVHFDEIWLFVIVPGWYLTPYFCLYLTLYKGISMTPDSLSAYTWLFISISGDMWLLASVFWWHLTFHQCILVILDFLSVNFDASGVCSIFWWHLTLLDSFISTSGNMWLFAIAFWWYLTLCEFILITLDYLSVNFDDSGVCSVFWWHLTLLDSFISTSVNNVTLRNCILMILDPLWIHFDYTWLFISKFWWFWSLQCILMAFDPAWLFYQYVW